MIRMPRQNRHRTIKLLGKDDPDDLMRQGHGAERDLMARFFNNASIKPIRATNDENHGFHGLFLPSLVKAGKFGT